jgi:hypothetical protein
MAAFCLPIPVASRGVAAGAWPRRSSGLGSGVDMRFGVGFGGYSWNAGNKPQPSAGPSPRPALAKVPR